MRRHVHADVGVAAELDPFGFHLLDAAPDLVFLELEVGNAVHQQAARTIGPLEDGDRVAGAIELLRRGEAGGSAADDGDLLAGARRRRLGDDPAFVEAAIGDRHFDLLDRDRIFVDAEHAGVFARRGADAAGELGEVVRARAAGRALLANGRDTPDRSSRE